MQDDIFTSRSGTPEDILTAQLSALVAPLAKNSNAVIDDPGLLDVARAVFAAYASTPTVDGLTMRELRAACAHVCDDDAVFEQRFHTFQVLRMLLPAFEKKYEQRYILHPISMVGMHVTSGSANGAGSVNSSPCWTTHDRRSNTTGPTRTTSPGGPAEESAHPHHHRQPPARPRGDANP
ncbi:hypothetical protein [Nocardiopsis alborubida]|uniref:Uncharacterized protein n=1 Tax=Nocardiopsis alborubida TaxID=146802 RepID=A0A7X6MGS4_9ACTN|nr:hypothetical protein [Nocardiopsis alborubida]NKZ01329.1 hypothetical protein [Nocardiopsis alborubida]